MNQLGLFVKQPIPGRVKTRLAAAVGPVRAAEIAEAFIGDAVERFRDAADRRLLCYAPDAPASRAWCARLSGSAYGLWPQPSGDLGERLASCVDRFLSGSGRTLVLMGSDSPSLPRKFVTDAFRRLETCDCVLGPATDGGYYLIGLRRPCASLFAGISWSTADVLDQTLARVEQAGLNFALLPSWYDVDTIDDWQRLRGHWKSLTRAGADCDFPRTARLLQWDTGDDGESL